MEDLFEREQKILEHAISYLEQARANGSCSLDEYASMVKAYRMLLKHMRRITRLSDRTAVNLTTSNLDLLDKVHFDGLTGIYNRRFLEENLGKTVERLRSSGQMLGVLMVDVDFFKNYNDTYGHGRGDDCLRAVAGALQQNLLRPEDFVARYGGEEFMVVMPKADEEEIRTMARRILDQIRQLRIPHSKSQVAEYVTVSVGAAFGAINENRSPEDFLSAADKALYRSKWSGRDQYTFTDMEDNGQ